MAPLAMTPFSNQPSAICHLPPSRQPYEKSMLSRSDRFPGDSTTTDLALLGIVIIVNTRLSSGRMTGSPLQATRQIPRQGHRQRTFPELILPFLEASDKSLLPTIVAPTCCLCDHDASSLHNLTSAIGHSRLRHPRFASLRELSSGGT